MKAYAIALLAVLCGCSRAPVHQVTKTSAPDCLRTPCPAPIVSSWPDNGTRLYKPSELPLGFSGTFSLRSLEPTNGYTTIVVSDRGGAVVSIAPNGSTTWNGRKVKTDKEFRAAMIAMAKTLEYGCRK